MKFHNFSDLISEIDKIEFKTSELENSLKAEFSSLFSIENFNEESFINFAKEKEKEMILKNSQIHRDFSEKLNQVNKSYEIAENKNKNEIQDFVSKTEEKTNKFNVDFSEIKKIHSSKVFDLKIKNETSKSEHYSVFEEEISQINKEIKEIKERFLIDQNRLENEKNIKLHSLEKTYTEQLKILNSKLEDLKEPFNQELESLRSEFNNEQSLKDESYLAIKKSYTQSSIKFNDFIKDVKQEFNNKLNALNKEHTNKINDIKIEIEDLKEFYETAKDFIQSEYQEKVKALDIVFDVHKNDHNTRVQKIRTDHYQIVTEINAKYRSLRDNLNNLMRELEHNKNKSYLKATSIEEKNLINSKFKKEYDSKKKEILKLNEQNEFELLQQNIILEYKIFEQDLKHLNHVNEWRYTKDVYEKERNNQLKIENAKFEHELLILNEKINLEKEIFAIKKQIHTIKLDKQLLPIESQLYLASHLQTRDINLLNLEFEAYKIENQLKYNNLKLQKDLDELEITHEINLLKTNYEYDVKITNIKTQLEIEKAILQRDSELEVLNLNIKLQETLLNHKNTRFDTALSSTINKLNLEIEKQEKEIQYEIKNLKNEAKSEKNKRNYIINDIKIKNQQIISNMNLDKTIALSRHETEYYYELNKEFSSYILDLYKKLYDSFIAFTKFIELPSHPNEIRKLHDLISNYNHLILLNAFNTLNAYMNYEKNSFNKRIDSYIESELKSKHENIINIYSQNIESLKTTIIELNERISNLESNNKELNERIESNILLSQSIKNQPNYSANIDSKQIQLLEDENKANNHLIEHNLNLIKSINKEIKRQESLILSLSKKQSKDEKKLIKLAESDKYYYSKLFEKHENKYNLFRQYLTLFNNKFLNQFDKFNQDRYIDLKEIKNRSNIIDKQFKKHYDELIKKSFMLLSFWYKSYLNTTEIENKNLIRFVKSTNRACEENKLDYSKSLSLSMRENTYNKKLYEKEIKRIENELNKLNSNTTIDIKITHDQYNLYYKQTESNISDLKQKTANKIQIINDNLLSAVNTMNHERDKLIIDLENKYDKNKTNILADLIINRNEIETTKNKTNSRINLLVERYNKNRKNHLEEMKNRRNKYNSIIKKYNNDIAIQEETYNLRIKRNLNRTKAIINEFDLQFNNDKVLIRKERRKEIRNNKKRLKQSFKFKKKQMNKKKK